MIQPALCAHTVVTLGQQPSLIVRCEGNIEDDHKRRQQVLNYFSSGLDERKLAVCAEATSDKTLLKSWGNERSQVVR